MIPIGTFIAYKFYKTTTPYGQCVNFRGTINPDLKYEPSALNIVLNIIVFESVVSADGFNKNKVICPVGVS